MGNDAAIKIADEGFIRNKYGRCKYGFEKDLDGHFVHIYNLFIFPEYRGMGYARAILKEAINIIKATGYKGEIQIVADPSGNCISLDKLKSFYRKMGLKVFDYYG